MPINVVEIQRLGYLMQVIQRVIVFHLAKVMGKWKLFLSVLVREDLANDGI